MPRKIPYHDLAHNELIDIFHNGITEKYKSYLGIFQVIFLGKELFQRQRN
jgi:hypothetical protein